MQPATQLKEVSSSCAFCIFTHGMLISLVGLRSKEIKKLRAVSYIQNMNLNLTSIIPGVATVLTFLVHTLLGYSLKTTEVSDITVQTVFQVPIE